MTAPLCVTKPIQHAEVAALVIWRVDDKIVDVERQPALLHREPPECHPPIVPGLGHMVHQGS